MVFCRHSWAATEIRYQINYDKQWTGEMIKLEAATEVIFQKIRGLRYTRISRLNEQFNIARTNTLRLTIHLKNTESQAYEHSNKFNDISYDKKWIQLTNTFQKYIIFVSWGSPVFTAMRIWIVAFCVNIPLIAAFHTKTVASVCRPLYALKMEGGGLVGSSGRPVIT
jgi:hypothetical protein